MEFARRSLLNAANTLAAACATESATSACSLSAPVRPKRFDDFACRKQIVELVDMLNRGVVIEEAEIDAWLEERPIVFDEDLLWSGAETMSPAAFIRNFKISDGKLDSKPIRISEISQPTLSLCDVTHTPPQTKRVVTDCLFMMSIGHISLPDTSHHSQTTGWNPYAHSQNGSLMPKWSSA